VAGDDEQGVVDADAQSDHAAEGGGDGGDVETVGCHPGDGESRAQAHESCHDGKRHGDRTAQRDHQHDHGSEQAQRFAAHVGCRLGLIADRPAQHGERACSPQRLRRCGEVLRTFFAHLGCGDVVLHLNVGHAAVLGQGESALSRERIDDAGHVGKRPGRRDRLCQRVGVGLVPQGRSVGSLDHQDPLVSGRGRETLRQPVGGRLAVRAGDGVIVDQLSADRDGSAADAQDEEQHEGYHLASPVV
jgi:hypothetical protein